ncbi:uncharacterized protein BXZ73DRAFT_98071 [Epithele typhae]|uniref:uncharacterized protein n=1 Tax=Epithele typhae TaxID=378194 RepID=UPI002007EA29|nr:uncharacterized protein BXZ73DRAFT_98071 [Epithele typhae]KAH9941682.1 hypothetical protein BXZ73DRAFT_98071 [Epithele typhae]
MRVSEIAASSGFYLADGAYVKLTMDIGVPGGWNTGQIMRIYGLVREPYPPGLVVPVSRRPPLCVGGCRSDSGPGQHPGSKQLTQQRSDEPDTPPRVESPSGSVAAPQSERDRTFAALSRLEPPQVVDLVDPLMSLPKRERPTCLFNVEALRAKIADAKTPQPRKTNAPPLAESPHIPALSNCGPNAAESPSTPATPA